MSVWTRQHIQPLSSNYCTDSLGESVRKRNKSCGNKGLLINEARNRPVPQKPRHMGLRRSHFVSTLWMSPLINGAFVPRMCQPSVVTRNNSTLRKIKGFLPHHSCQRHYLVHRQEGLGIVAMLIAPKYSTSWASLVATNNRCIKTRSRGRDGSSILSVLLSNITKIHNPKHSGHEREATSLSRKNRQRIQSKHNRYQETFLRSALLEPSLSYPPASYLGIHSTSALQHLHTAFQITPLKTAQQFRDVPFPPIQDGFAACPLFPRPV